MQHGTCVTAAANRQRHSRWSTRIWDIKKTAVLNSYHSSRPYLQLRWVLASEAWALHLDSKVVSTPRWERWERWERGKQSETTGTKSGKVPPRVYFSTSIESLHSLAKPSCCWALPANCGPQALRSQSLWQLQHGAVQNAFWSCILDKWCGAAVYQETKQSSSRVQLLIDQDFYISGHWICLIFSGSLEIGFPRNPPTNPPRNLWRDAAGLASAPEHGPGENTLPGRKGPQGPQAPQSQ